MSVIVISGGRGSGKTQQLIEWAKDNPGSMLLVASDEMRAEIIRREPNLKGRVLTPFLVRSNALAGYRDGHTKIGVDNLEDVISELTGLPVGAVTITTK